MSSTLSPSKLGVLQTNESGEGSDDVAALTKKLEDALYDIEELEQKLYDSEFQVAEAFEGDCWAALKGILNHYDYNWNDGPVTADDAAQFIFDIIQNQENHIKRLESQLKE